MIDEAEPAARGAERSGHTRQGHGIAGAIARLSGWRRFGLGVGAGVLFALGHAPVGLPWFAFVALPLLVLLTGTAQRGRGAFAAGWSFGFGYLLIALHWIGHAFLVDAEAFAWMLPFALTGLPALLALFWGLASWAAWRVAPGGGPGTVIALAAALTLTEFARSHVLTGFPWALPGYVWIGTPLDQMAAWIGPHGLGLLTIALTALPFTAFATYRPRPATGVAATALIVFAGLWFAGSARLAAAPNTPSDATVLRIAQPNAPQHLKWDPEYAPLFYRRLLEATAAEPDAALGPPDLVIWPETAVAFLPEEQPEGRAQIAQAAAGAPLVLGALRRRTEAEGGGFANSLFVLGTEGAVTARYDKHHLVPFGEYVPFQSFFSALGVRQLAQRGRFVPGPGPMLTRASADIAPFLPLICYEAIFPHEIAAATGQTRPGWLLQITNDAWFGTLGGPQQHLAQAQLRAIEQGLPLVRAANTGISAVIDSHGRVTASLPLGVHGKLDAALPAALPATPYARFGDIPAIISCFLLFSAGFLMKLRYRAPRG
ncbi:MAG: apolipoprotein N-acyltransferase [Pseudomonadota bacterium]